MPRRNRVSRSLRRLGWRLRRVSWLSVCVFLATGVCVTLIVVPGERTYSGIRWFDTGAAESDARLQQAVEDRYRAEGLASDEQVFVERYRHGWPLTFLTRAVGGVFASKPNAAGTGFMLSYARGHRSNEPLLSVTLPANGESYEFGPAQPGGVLPLVVIDWKTTPIDWSGYLHWPIAIDAREWRWRALMVNLAILLALPIVAGAATEWWVRRRGGAMRVRLVDLLVMVALLAATLGWRQSHASLHAKEQSLTRQGQPWWLLDQPLRDEWAARRKGEASGLRWRREQTGPVWLSRLLGNKELLPSSRHLTALQLTPDESWDANIDRLPDLMHLEWVSLRRGATRRVVEQLAKLPRLRRIDLALGPPPGTGAIDESADLQGKDWLGPGDLAELHALPIERLHLMGKDLLAADIRRAASIPTLRTIELIDALVLPAEEGELRKAFPDVEFRFVWGEYWTSRFGDSARFNEKSPGGMSRRIEAAKQRRAAGER